MAGFITQRVLVLNRLWQPVQTCTARRAIKLLCVGNAKVVQTHGEEKFMTHDFPSWLDYSTLHEEEEMIHSISLSLCIPQIIVLGAYDRMPKLKVKFTRQNVFHRDQYTCQYCRQTFSEEKLNLDHLIPRDKGGATTWDNIVTSCFKCNSKKGNKMPREARMFPMQEPKAPKWRPSYADKIQSGYESWNEFINPDGSRVQVSN